jgi:hypothetical protein
MCCLMRDFRSCFMAGRYRSSVLIQLRPFCASSSLDRVNKKLRGDLRLPKGCVIHSLRHTFLTKLGDVNADAFTIEALRGHSTVTISERNNHPTLGRPGTPFERFANLNQTAVEKAEKDWASLGSVRQSGGYTACKLLCPCSSMVRAADS